MIAAKSKHPNCAYKWMDYIASPKVNAQVAEYFGEAPANPKACEQTSDKTFCDGYHAADAAYAAQDPLLDDADQAVPRRPHRRELHRLRRVDEEVAGDQGLTLR